MAASLQAFSHGRLVLGMARAGMKASTARMATTSRSVRIRIAQMVEAVRLMRTMWTASPASFEGNS